ncbi:MAG: lysophospholipid acyltransferase family protein [Bacteroidota bacterium]
MINRLLVKLFEIYCKIVLKTYSPVKVSGTENLPNAPYLIYSNHNSHLDYIILSVFSNLGFQKTCVLVAKDYWYDNRFRRWFANVFFNAIPVDRNMLFRAEAISEIVEKCRHKIDPGGANRSLIIFPEGKRSVDGKIQNFKIGPAAIAHQLNLTLVPAYIDGSRHVWPKGKLFMKPGRIKLLFGSSMKLTDDRTFDSEAFDLIKTNTATLQDKLLEVKKMMETGQSVNKKISEYTHD